MFGALKKLGRNLQRIDLKKEVESILREPQLQAQMIDLNRAQMFDKGIDSKGDSLGEYSAVSVDIYGKQPGHIRLYETGEFYGSMEVKVEDGNAYVTGDMVKDEKDLEGEWPDALGLTKESVGEIIPEFRDRLVEKVKQKMFA